MQDQRKKLFWKNFKRIAWEKNYSTVRIADELGISRASVSYYLNGKAFPKHETIERLAALLGVDVEDFFAPGAADNNSVNVPILGFVPAGDPLEATEHIIDYENVAYEIAHGKKLFALIVHGDSMWPTLVDGERVIVNVQDTFYDGDIVVASIDGSTTIKRLRKNDNGIALIPDNPEFGSYVFFGEEIHSKRLRLIGKAIEARKEL